MGIGLIELLILGGVGLAGLAVLVVIIVMIARKKSG